MSKEESEVTEAGPGSLLKQVREQQGLSTAEVAERLKLMEQSVKNIEADDYKDIPLTFYKGYIKNYAQLLGLDPNKACETFSQYAQKVGLETKSGLTPTYRSENLMRRKNVKAVRWFVKIISFLIVLAIVYSIYFLLIEKGYWNKFIDSFDKSNTQQEQPLNTDENEGELIPETNLKLESSQGTTLELTAEPSQDVEDTSLELQELPLSTPGSTNPVENSSEESAFIPVANEPLVLNFSGDCWIQVVDATGRVLVSGTKTAGHISQVSGQEPYQLTIGKVSSVAIQYNGADVDLSSYSDSRIAKLTLGG